MESNPIRAVVLCVDDDEALLCLLQTALMTNGYAVLVASDGREALTLMSGRRLDAIVLDYSMPGMNGGEVVLEVKHTRPETPIILFSGSQDIPPSTVAQVDALVRKGEGLRPLLPFSRGCCKVRGRNRRRYAGSPDSPRSCHLP
jgi:CheY-like chemotaxis protein